MFKCNDWQIPCTHKIQCTHKVTELCAKEAAAINLLTFILQYFSPRAGEMGRSRRYCNTGPTRGEVGASP
jgi:hypothetical protein